MAATNLPFLGNAGTPVTGGGWAGANAMNTATVGQAAGGFNQIVPAEYYAIDKEVFVINGESYPLTVFLNSNPMKRIVDADTIYRWKEQKPLPERDTASGSCAVGAAIIPVNNPTMYTIRDEIACLNPACQGWVTAVGALTITVQWTHAPVGAIVPNSVIFKLNNAHYQIDFPNTQPYTNEVEYHNTYQISEHDLAISSMAAAGNYQFPVGGKWAHEMNMKREQHLVEKEKVLLFGQQLLNVTWGNSPAGFCEGLYYRCTTNKVSNGNLVLTRAGLDNYFARLFRNRAGAKPSWVHLCSSMQLSQISQLFYGMERTTTRQNQAGMYITDYRHPEGPIVQIKRHPLLDFLGLDDLGITLNMDAKAVSLVHHKDCPGMRRREAVIPYNGTYQQAGYQSIFTLKVADEEGHIGVLEDVAAAA